MYIYIYYRNRDMLYKFIFILYKNYNNGRTSYQFLPGRPIYDPPRQGNSLYFLYINYI
jgi:hypothetical protein